MVLTDLACTEAPAEHGWALRADSAALRVPSAWTSRKTHSVREPFFSGPTPLRSLFRTRESRSLLGCARYRSCRALGLPCACGGGLLVGATAVVSAQFETLQEPEL